MATTRIGKGEVALIPNGNEYHTVEYEDVGATELAITCYDKTGFSREDIELDKGQRLVGVPRVCGYLVYDWLDKGNEILSPYRLLQEMRNQIDFRGKENIILVDIFGDVMGWGGHSSFCLTQNDNGQPTEEYRTKYLQTGQPMGEDQVRTLILQELMLPTDVKVEIEDTRGQSTSIVKKWKVESRER